MSIQVFPTIPSPTTVILVDKGAMVTQGRETSGMVVHPTTGDILWVPAEANVETEEFFPGIKFALQVTNTIIN